jgi:hypothetical protein
MCRGLTDPTSALERIELRTGMWAGRVQNLRATSDQGKTTFKHAL